jgi:hypothetical protein
VLVALLMVPLLVLAAFSLDVGWWQVGANQLQTSADAAALAGARALQLDTTAAPHANVTTQAAQLAASNRAFSQPVAVTLADVEGRIWNPDLLAFTDSGWVADRTNTVQVTARATPGLILAGIVRDSAPTISRRAAAWIANINQLDCVKPWTLPYDALYDRIAGLTGINASAASPRPPLTQRQVAALTLGNFSSAARTLVLRGPNTPAAGPVAAARNWTGHRFGGAGNESAVYGNIQGCDPTPVSVARDEGAQVADADYECWVARALAGLGPSADCSGSWYTGANRAPCHFKSDTDAGCYPSAVDASPGVRLRVAWSDVAAGVDHRVVGTVMLVCAFRGAGAPGVPESCTLPEGTTYTGLPRGTLAVTFQGLTTVLRFEESMDFGNVTGLDQRLLLVR